MKRVLVAAYYFPPYADVSGTRVTKFCKYLPAHGWQPTVFTVDPRYYGSKVVEGLPPEVATMTVRRIPYLPVPAAILLVKLLFPLLICTAAWQERRHLAAVYLVGSPFHPFVSTVVLTGLLGIPSLLDFRDSWSINPMFSRFRHGWQRYLVRRSRGLIERLGIRHASAVAFAAPGLQAEYAAELPHYRDKFHTIDNGFDPADFTALTPERLSPKPTLIITGKLHFYSARVTVGLLKALGSFPELHFLYVGGEAALIRELARRVGAAQQVTTLAFQPMERVLRLIQGADYGLAVSAARYQVGTKIFEYLALGKPALCLVPHGSAMTTTFAGIPTVLVRPPPHTPASIREGLRQLLACRPGIEPEVAARFSRRNTSASLAGLLDRITCP